MALPYSHEKDKFICTSGVSNSNCIYIMGLKLKLHIHQGSQTQTAYTSGVSNSNRSKGQMRTYEVIPRVTS